MKELGIAAISTNNILRRSYIKTIKTWNVDEEFLEKAMDKPIIGVFYNNNFLGASIMDFNSSLEASIYVVNGSDEHKEEINEYFEEELKTLALKNGATSITFNEQKEIEKQIKLAKIK